MKVYAVEIMDSKLPTYVTLEEVAKIATAINSGAKLVLVGNDLINPSSIKRIRRQWEMDQKDLDKRDEDLRQILGAPDPQLLE